MIEIDDLKPEEITAAQDLVAQAFVQYLGRFTPWPEFAAQAQRISLDAQNQVLVARVGGQLLGLLQLQLPLLASAPQAGQIVQLAVAPAYRRRSIGRILTIEAIQRCADAGCLEVLAPISLPMKQAQALLGSLGFVPQGELAPAFGQPWELARLDLGAL